MLKMSKVKALSLFLAIYLSIFLPLCLSISLYFSLALSLFPYLNYFLQEHGSAFMRGLHACPFLLCSRVKFTFFVLILFAYSFFPLYALNFIHKLPFALLHSLCISQSIIQFFSLNFSLHHYFLCVFPLSFSPNTSTLFISFAVSPFSHLFFSFSFL